jgi:hypothetical protein
MFALCGICSGIQFLIEGFKLASWSVLSEKVISDTVRDKNVIYQQHNPE